ncbi:MAG: heme-copper oxidase subunit III [Thermosynechococcaceae cyanobacterium]
MSQSSSPTSAHRDESPLDLQNLHRRLPSWLQRFIPSGGGQHEDHHGKGMFGVTLFLLSESMVFVSFFASYIMLRLHTVDWIPSGITGPQASADVILHTAVLVSSSFVIYFAERALDQNKLTRFRLLWLTTSAMGVYFLIGEVQEWQGLDFGLTTGLMGGTFYILTGFHGLHVATGIVLQTIMLGRSFRLHNYAEGHFGVSAAALFWHFVDVIWIVLFCLIYLW